MEPIGLVEGIARLGALGVLAALLFWTFFKYIPHRDREYEHERERREGDAKVERETWRQMVKAMASECHVTHKDQQAAFLEALARDRHAHGNIITAQHGAISDLKGELRANTLANQQLTAAVLQKGLP